MPQDATCPSCSNVFPVTEARGAFTVPCPRCETDLTVEFRKLTVPHEAGQPHYDLSVKPGKLDAPPAAPAPTKRKRDDDDDDDDADAKARAGGSGIVILSGLLGLFFVLGGLGLTTWLLFYEIDTESASNTNSNPNTNRSNNSGNNNKGNTGGNTKGTNPGGGGNKGTNPGGGGGDPFPPPPPPPDKPKNEFTLTPVIGTQQLISAPQLTADSETIALPAPAGSVAVGGNGRYIVMHLPRRKTLAVFDVNTLQVTESNEPSDGDGTQIAAGQNRMVTLHNNILRVWTLPGLKRQYDATAPQLAHGINTMAMGSATNGPLLVSNAFGQGFLVDIGERGLKLVEGSAGEFGGGLNTRLRASANGKLFVRGGFGFNDKSVYISESRRQWQSPNADLACAVPAADARHVFGFGGITRDGTQQVGQKVGGPGMQTVYVPAVTVSPYFLRLREAKDASNKQVVTLTAHRSTINPEKEKAVDIGRVPETEGLVNFFFGSTVPLDQHLFLIPEAKVLVTIPVSKDKIVVRKVDVR